MINIVYPAYLLTKKKSWGVLVTSWRQLVLAGIIGANIAISIVLLGSGILTSEVRERLSRVASALDPVRLLQQVQVLQDALWRQFARTPSAAGEYGREAATPPVRFNPTACTPNDSLVTRSGDVGLRPEVGELAPDTGKRKYHRTKKSLGPRTYRTRPDPFEAVASELRARFLGAPGITAKLLFTELEYPDVLLRTLQRRVHDWRREVVVEFDDRLVSEDLLAGGSLPRPIRAVSLSAAG